MPQARELAAYDCLTCGFTFETHHRPLPKWCEQCRALRRADVKVRVRGQHARPREDLLNLLAVEAVNMRCALNLAYAALRTGRADVAELVLAHELGPPPSQVWLVLTPPREWFPQPRLPS